MNYQLAHPKERAAANPSKSRSPVRRGRQSLPASRRRNPERDLSVVKAIGWFSLGLGLVQILAPDRLSRTIGIRREHHRLMRLLGLREIVSGLGILSQRHPAPWMWSRVAGDAVDLALLGNAFRGPGGNTNRLLGAAAAVTGLTLADVLYGQRLTRRVGNACNEGLASRGPVQVTRTITINRSAEDLYTFWRNFENLPRFMAHLKSVQVTDAGRSHWIARGPLGKSVQWDAEVIDERPHDRIAWRSLPGADVENSGSVEFAPAVGDRGTIVKVRVEYRPPGGRPGALIAKLLGEEPSEQIRDDLRFFKQLMETGVIATTRGQPAGRKHGTSWKFDHRTPEMTSAPETLTSSIR